MPSGRGRSTRPRCALDGVQRRARRTATDRAPGRAAAPHDARAAGRLRRRGAPAHRAPTHSATLEDVFVTLTGRHCAMTEPPPAGAITRSSQLTLVRYREFFREPEAVFWVFGFPVLLALALGIAFREPAPDAIQVAVVVRPPARRRAGRRAATRPTGARARSWPTGRARGAAHRQGLAGRRARRTARWLPLRPRRAPRAAPRASRSTTRCSAPPAAPTRAGHASGWSASRARATSTSWSRACSGMNLMGSGIWGLGFAIVDARARTLLKRLVATPMSRAAVPRVVPALAAASWCSRSAVLLGFAVLVFGVPVRGSLLAAARRLSAGARSRSAAGLLIASRAADHRGRLAA